MIVFRFVWAWFYKNVRFSLHYPSRRWARSRSFQTHSSSSLPDYPPDPWLNLCLHPKSTVVLFLLEIITLRHCKSLHRKHLLRQVQYYDNDLVTLRWTWSRADLCKARSHYQSFLWVESFWPVSSNYSTHAKYHLWGDLQFPPSHCYYSKPSMMAQLVRFLFT